MMDRMSNKATFYSQILRIHMIRMDQAIPKEDAEDGTMVEATEEEGVEEVVLTTKTRRR